MTLTAVGVGVRLLCCSKIQPLQSPCSPLLLLFRYCDCCRCEGLRGRQTVILTVVPYSSPSPSSVELLCTLFEFSLDDDDESEGDLPSSYDRGGIFTALAWFAVVVQTLCCWGSLAGSWLCCVRWCCRHRQLHRRDHFRFRFLVLW